MDEQTKQYLKSYENCLILCGRFSEDEPEEDFRDCVKGYTDEDPELCQKIKKSCDIVNSPQFRELLIFLIKFLKFMYCVRSEHNNKYDEYIITTVGNLDLESFGLDINKLDCINYPDDNSSYLSEMPHNLKEYLTIMNRISVIYENKEHLASKQNDDVVLSGFKKFCDDFQPWSTSLNTFVNIYSLKTGLIAEPIPNIRTIKSYGEFISNCDKVKMRELISLLPSNVSEFHSKLIAYIKSEEYVSGGNMKSCKTRKGLRKTNKKKKSQKKSRKNKRRFK